jgi:hypothetical protein
MKHIGNDHTKSRAVEVKCSNAYCRVARTDKALRHDHAWLTKVATENWNRRPAATQAPSAPVALDTIRDLDRIGMQLAADLCKLPVVVASNKRNVDYLSRQDVMDLVVAWRAVWNENSASRPPIDRAALSVKAETAAIPDGYALVPLQVTDDMVVAFCETWYSAVRCFDDPEMQDAYAAMLTAAPTPPTTGEA